MSNLKVNGTIKAMLEIEKGVSKAGKEWQKRSFIIDTKDMYNPDLCISVFGDEKVADLSRYEVGQDVEVSINLYSREFSGKWYHNVDAFRIELKSTMPQGMPQGGPAPMNLDSVASPISANTAESEDDDLPF
jgi:hypothetical protein